EGNFGTRAQLDIVTDWPLDKSPLPAGVTVRAGVRANGPEWLDVWRDADIFVLPTHSEAFGIVFQEAAAAGLPVIAPRLAAIPEIVQHDQTGLLYEPGDMAGLAAA